MTVDRLACLNLQMPGLALFESGATSPFVLRRSRGRGPESTWQGTVHNQIGEAVQQSLDIGGLGITVDEIAAENRAPAATGRPSPSLPPSG